MKSIGFASLTFIALSASQLSAAPAIGSASPTVDRPLSEMSQNALKVPRKILLGDLVVNKAQARVYPGAAVGLPSPKVQLQVSYCAKNVGATQVAGPLRAKFYWDGIGPYGGSSAPPGVQGSLLEHTSAGLASGAEWCSVIKLNFDSSAQLMQMQVLGKNPTVGVWAQGKNEGANPTNDISNNTKAVTQVGAF
jgi:hypothetical protein